MIFAVVVIVSIVCFAEAVRIVKSSTTFNVKDIPGILPPTGYFDPLNLASTVDSKEIKRWRESELKHGRLAML